MRSRRLVAAVITGVMMGGLALICSGMTLRAPAVGAMAIDSEEEWVPLFADDFSGTTLPAACTANDGPASGLTASYYRPDEVSVAEGMLRLGLRSDAYAGRPYISGGLGCSGLNVLYGRYEYRARITAVSGITSVVALLPADGTTTDTTTIEIFSETDASGTRARVSNSYVGGSIRNDRTGLTLDGFHEYQIDWSPSGLRVFIDGEEIFSDSNASGKYRWPEFAMSAGGGEAGAPNPDDLPAEFLIDWLRVYEYQGVDPTTSDSRNVSASSSTTWRTPTSIALLLGVVMGFTVCVVVIYFGLALGIPRRLRRGRSTHRF